MTGMMTSGSGVPGLASSSAPLPAQDLPRGAPARGCLRTAGREAWSAVGHASSVRRFLMLDVGRWPFDRINRELHELACQGWKLIAVAGYGQCGVRLWLVKPAARVDVRQSGEQDKKGVWDD